LRGEIIRHEKHVGNIAGDQVMQAHSQAP
jgi:hypothetical protein